MTTMVTVGGGPSSPLAGPSVPGTVDLLTAVRIVRPRSGTRSPTIESAGLAMFGARQLQDTKQE